MKQTYINKQKINTINQGFTLTEMLIATTIMGELSAIAIPSYIGVLDSSKQREAQSTVAQVEAIIMAYIDETGESPRNWKHLNSIAAIMHVDAQGKTDQAEFTDFQAITLPGKNYILEINAPSTAVADGGDGNGSQDGLGGSTESSSIYLIKAEPTNTTSKRDIQACINISNGASDLTTGDDTTAAGTPNCA